MRQVGIQQKSGTRRDIAIRYGLSEGTLANHAWLKRGPKFYKRGRRAIYFFEDVEAWLKENPVLTTDSLPDEG
jgi:hypothetical protein